LLFLLLKSLFFLELNIRDEKIQILLKQVETKNAELNATSKVKKLYDFNSFYSNYVFNKKKQSSKTTTSSMNMTVPVSNEQNSSNVSNEQVSSELAKKDSEIQLLKVKQKKLEHQIKSLNRKLAKLGINVQDITEEIVEVISEKPKEEKQIENVEKIDINELEVLKYKNEQEIETIKKDYESQLENLNNKVKFFKLTVCFCIKNSNTINY
jgi:hypothetical protein